MVAHTLTMRRLTAILCLTLAVLLGSPGMYWSVDFQKGLTAYRSGTYANALREWTQPKDSEGYVAIITPHNSIEHGKACDKRTAEGPSYPRWRVSYA